MANLTPAKRKHMPQSQFGLAGKRFPMNDKTHQRLAISGATRSQHAGNISASTAARIKSEARSKLGASPGGYRPQKESAAHERKEVAKAKRLGISYRQYEKIEDEGARESPGGYIPNPQESVTARMTAATHPRMHALAHGSATLLHSMGHIGAADKARIIAKSITARKKATMQPPLNATATAMAPAAAPAFGSLAPQLEPEQA